jgi:hypothetical protein
MTILWGRPITCQKQQVLTVFRSCCLQEYLKHIGNVVGDKDFQNYLEKAGSIATLIGLGIKLYKDVKDRARSRDERAFNLLIMAAFECAEESIPENISSKIRISDESKDIRKNIFTTEHGWDYYLPVGSVGSVSSRVEGSVGSG